MLGSLQSLTNMEYMLYGNTPSFGSLNAPSIVNGYCINSAYMNPYYSPYNMCGAYSPYSQSYQPYGDIFSEAGQGQGGASQVSFAAQQDIDKIANFYSKNSAPSESMLGAAAGGAAFGIFNNPRLIAHPINSCMALKDTNAMFDIKNNKVLNNLWKDPKTNDLMREAYFRMHKVEARKLWKLGLFRKQLSEKDYKELKKIMDSALKTGKPEEIERAIAKLEHAYVNDGWISKPIGQLCDQIRGLRGKPAKPRTVTEAIKDSNGINEKLKRIKGLKDSAKFTSVLKRGGGLKGGALMMAFEFIFGAENIKAAFSKDNSTGMKQLGQTFVKGVGNTAGWVAGEAAGVWAATKICASIGTAISPGLGTAIGGVLGLIGGSIGCWLAGKATKSIVGQDVGEKVKIENMKKTQEGQIQLLNLTLQQKNIPLDVQQSINNVATAYNLAA